VEATATAVAATREIERATATALGTVLPAAPTLPPAPTAPFGAHLETPGPAMDTPTAGGAAGGGLPGTPGGQPGGTPAPGNGSPGPNGPGSGSGYAGSATADAAGGASGGGGDGTPAGTGAQTAGGLGTIPKRRAAPWIPPVDDGTVNQMWARYGSPWAGVPFADRLTRGKPGVFGHLTFYLLLLGLLAAGGIWLVQDLWRRSSGPGQQ
jgi:hypothetical protein